MKLKIVDFKMSKRLWVEDTVSWLFQIDADQVGVERIIIPLSMKSNRFLLDVYTYYKNDPELFTLEHGRDIYDLMVKADSTRQVISQGSTCVWEVDNFQEAVDYAVSRWQNK